MGFCAEQKSLKSDYNLNSHPNGVDYEHVFSFHNKKSSSIILLSKTTVCKISAPLEKRGTFTHILNKI